MKRFVAALLLAVLVMSMCCTVALATCELGHRWDKFQTVTTYEQYTVKGHKKIDTEWSYCSICDARYVKWRSQKVTIEEHAFRQTGHYHLEGTNKDKIITLCDVCGYKSYDIVNCECNN